MRTPHLAGGTLIMNAARPHDSRIARPAFELRTTTFRAERPALTRRV
jgi:hypothetical protein